MFGEKQKTTNDAIFKQCLSTLFYNVIDPLGWEEWYQAPAVNRQHKLPISTPSSWSVCVCAWVCARVCEISWYLS